MDKQLLRTAISIGVLVLLGFSHLYVAALEPMSLAASQSAILVVGDLREKGGFAFEVLSGARDAVFAADAGSLATPEVVAVDMAPFMSREGQPASSSGLATFLLRHVARFNVSAVIDATISDIAPMVVATFAHVGIPVLTTVSTNESTLSHSHGYALRLIASNKKQAEKVSQWIGDANRAAIIHDMSPYALALHRDIMATTTQNSHILTYPMPTGASAAGMMFQAVRLHQARVVVYLGYESRLREILESWSMVIEGLDAVETAAGGAPAGRSDSALRMLLSDGAYGRELRMAPRDALEHIDLCFPVTPSYDGNRTAFAQYGWDATRMVQWALMRQARNRDGASIITRLRHAGWSSDVRDLIKLGGPYRFGETGENEQAAFSVIRANMFRGEDK